ncbi:MAG: family 2 glycosyl transferase [Methanobacteriaceae archaeon]|nr:family 2 glycosyl transferase [Methanobacteriaceae archaeon]
MISIITVYNNRTLLEKCLLKSLDSQTANYELVLLDNKHKNFNSAAEALNYGGNKSKGDYLMFIHQDYDLESDTWLADAEEIIKNLENVGIVGLAGKYDRNMISNITTGHPPELAGPIQIEEPVKVQTLDECLFIIPKKIFEEIKFDEEVCDDWHLYAVDYCLSVKKAGYDVYVIPLGGYHASPGYSFTPEGYYSTLKKLVQKYKGDYKWIYTSTGSWSTVYPLFLQIAYQKLYYWLGLGK